MRTLARERLFQLVFEYQFNKENNRITLDAVAGQDKIDPQDFEYIESCYDGIVEKFDELVRTVSGLSEGFSPQRIFKTDLAILIVAAYELMYRPEIPASVSCNEAVELCKKYSTDKSPSFVNGILASLAKQITDDKS
ncbi:MAG: transcription antitermination factor NusB [Firmicutes bacterium]|nr:transcription antitermination factor NusB [Bacillota bacterium]